MSKNKKEIEEIDLGEIASLDKTSEVSLKNKKPQPKNEEEIKIPSKKRYKKNPVVVLLLVLTLVASFIYLVGTCLLEQSTVLTPDVLIPRLLLILFTILFVLFGLSIRQKKNAILLGATFLLLCYFTVNLLAMGNVLSLPFHTTKVEDLTGMSLTEVIAWAEKNDVEIEQEYEYSDMVEEYHVISQDAEEGKNLKDVNTITVAISEGASPYKEILLPNMIGWKDEEVLSFIEQNYLLDVDVEFIASEKQANTVIEQSKMGNIKRDEEFKLTFSYGEKRDGDQVKIADLSDKSEFAATFYLKQQGLQYKIKKDFSSKVKKGNVIKQSAEKGTLVDRNKDTVELSISKGPEIQIPDLTKMSLKEITDWIIENRLKLELTRKYDAKIKENDVIEANYKEKAIVAQGTIIKIVLSKGKLLMPKFKDFEEFKAWALKYDVTYQEEHEFSDTVKLGEVIEFSYKDGDTIQNGDTITVKISDGKANKVPNVVGKSKQEAINALKKAGFDYNTVYKSSSKKKDTVLSQSISAGSTVGEGTTITLSLSTGKESSSSSSKTPSTSTNKEQNSNSSSSSQGNSGSGNSSTPATPTCDPSVKTQVNIYPDLLDYRNRNPEGTCANIKGAYTDLKFRCDYVTGTGFLPGQLYNTDEINGNWFDHCSTIVLKIVES